PEAAAVSPRRARGTRPGPVGTPGPRYPTTTCRPPGPPPRPGPGPEPRRPPPPAGTPATPRASRPPPTARHSSPRPPPYGQGNTRFLRFRVHRHAHDFPGVAGGGQAQVPGLPAGFEG